jgi:broad specificity phosphatase PhoE
VAASPLDVPARSVPPRGRGAIALARHGETTWNATRRFQGQLDVPLNDTGRAQARALAERAAREGFAALYASPLRRARETAEIVGAALGLEPRLDERLMESDVGAWEGRLKDELARDEPEAWAAFRRAGADFRFPGGESLGEQQARVLAALADIEDREDGRPTLVVCHRGVIRCVLAHTSGRGLGTYHEWTVPNGELVWL